MDPIGLDEIVITFMSTFKARYWLTRAVAAHNTWASNFSNLFYVMEAASLTKQFFEREDCSHTKEFEFPRYNCSGEPPAVIVPCSGDYYGASGPCCKFDAATRYMLASSQPGQRFQNLKWWMFGDDDNFIFLPNYLQMLSRLDWRRPQYRSPVQRHQQPHLQVGMWHHNPQCEHLIEQRIAQPLVLSITALSRLETVAHSNGTTRLCQQWDITHDWGCALLFWQLGLEWGTMIGMGTPMERDYEEGNYHSVAMTPHINDTVFIHAAKRSADGKKEAGRLDFYEVWDRLKHVSPDRVAKVPTVEDHRGWAHWERSKPLRGFDTTKFSQRHPLVSDDHYFHPFPPHRCCLEHPPLKLFEEGGVCRKFCLMVRGDHRAKPYLINTYCDEAEIDAYKKPDLSSDWVKALTKDRDAERRSNKKKGVGAH